MVTSPEMGEITLSKIQFLFNMFVDLAAVLAAVLVVNTIIYNVMCGSNTAVSSLSQGAMASSSSALSLLLLLVLQLHCITSQGPIGFALPCGEDNFSCPRIGDISTIPLMCYTFDELCNGIQFCSGGSDEGNRSTIVSLECKPYSVGVYICSYCVCACRQSGEHGG